MVLLLIAFPFLRTHGGLSVCDLVSVEEAKTDTKDLASKVSKVTDTTDKIASNTNSYRAVLLSKPAQPNKAVTDPKVLSDME